MAKSKKKEVKKITAGHVFGWLLGILFLLSVPGFLILGAFSSAFFMLIIALVILPPARTYMREKLNFELSKGLTILIVIICFILYAVTVPDELTELDNQETTASNTQPQSPSVEEPIAVEAEVVEEPTPVVEPTPTEEEFDFGDEVTTQNFKWTIEFIEQRGRIGGEYLYDEADGIFLVAIVEVENIANTAKYLDGSFLKLVDSQGREYSSDPEANWYVEENIFFEQINPGVTKRGEIVYDVPEDLEVVEFKIADSYSDNSAYTLKYYI